MVYCWLFVNPDDDISGDIHIDSNNLPAEIQQVILLIVRNP